MPTDVVQAGLRQSSMWITRDAKTMQLEGWPQADIEQHQTTMQAVFEKSSPGHATEGYFVQVQGMLHPNFTDLPSRPRFSPGWVSPGRSMNSGRTTPSTPTRWRFLIST